MSGSPPPPPPPGRAAARLVGAACAGPSRAEATARWKGACAWARRGEAGGGASGSGISAALPFGRSAPGKN